MVILALALGCLVVTEAAGAPNARCATCCCFQGRCRMQHASLWTNKCHRMIHRKGQRHKYRGGAVIDHICRIRRGIAAIMFAGVEEDNLF